NLKNVFKPKKSANTETEPKSETKAEPETKPKSETKVEQKIETKTEQSNIASEANKTTTEPKAKAGSEIKSEPKTELKAEAKAAEAKQTTLEANELATESKVEQSIQDKLQYESDKQALREQLRGQPYDGDFPSQPVYEINEATGRPVYKQSMNDLIRSVDDISELPDYVRMQVELADENWANLKPSKWTQTLYRGETPYKGANGWDHYNYIKNLNVGETITDKGFMYASHDAILEAYSSGGVFTSRGSECIQYTIEVPQGANLLDCISEVIFPRKSQFKIISKNIQDNGVINIIMEYILPN
ncbi:hypothetical protein IJ670_07620, partial [bacterium]|nr:hypothetical protein [bacterium]